MLKIKKFSILLSLGLVLSLAVSMSCFPLQAGAAGYIPPKVITANDVIAADINNMIVYPHLGTPVYIQPGQTFTAEVAATSVTTAGWAAWVENDLKRWDCTVGTVSSANIYLGTKPGYTIQVTVPAQVSPELCTLVLTHAGSGKTFRAPMAVSIVPTLDTSFYTMNVTDTHFFRYGGSSASGQNDGKSIGLMAKVGTLAGVRFFSHTGDVSLSGEVNRVVGVRDYLMEPLVRMGRVPFIFAEGNHEYDPYVAPIPSTTTGTRTGDYDASVGDRFWGMRSQVIGMGSFAVAKHFYGAYFGDQALRDSMTVRWNAAFGAGSPYTYRLLLQHTHDSAHALFYNNYNPPPIAPYPSLELKGHDHSWSVSSSNPFLILSLGGGDSSSYGACTFLNFNLNGSVWSCPQATTSFGSANKVNTIIDARDGYDITALRDSYVNANDGTAVSNTCTIINDINFNFYDGRVRFNMAQGTYSVTGGTILSQYDYEDEAGWHTAVLVDVNIAPSATTTVSISSGTTVLLEDNFNAGTVGSAPANWILNTSGGTATVEAVPSSSDKSMRVQKTAANSGYAAGSRNFTQQTSGTVTVDTNVMVAETGSIKQVVVRDYSTTYIAVLLAFKDGNIRINDSSNVQTFTANTWYNIKFKINPAAKTYEVLINNVSKGTFNYYRSAAANVGEVLYVVSPNYMGTLYVSDVTITK